MSEGQRRFPDGTHFRVMGVGTVHVVKRTTPWSGVWSCCAPSIYDSPIEFSWLKATADPVDCIGCIAEGT